MNSKLKIALVVIGILFIFNALQGYDSYKKKETYSKIEKENISLKSTNKEITIQYRADLAKVIKYKSVKISPVIRNGKPVLGPDGQVLNTITTVDREENSTQSITQVEHQKIVEQEVAKVIEKYEAKLKEVTKSRSYRGQIFAGKSINSLSTKFDIGLSKPLLWKLDFVPILIGDTEALDIKNTLLFISIGYRF